MKIKNTIIGIIILIIGVAINLPNLITTLMREDLSEPEMTILGIGLIIEFVGFAIICLNIREPNE